MKAVKKSKEIFEMVVDLFLGDDDSITYVQKIKDNQAKYL